MQNLILQFLIAFVACIGFSIMFNIHKLKFVLVACLGGSIGWCVFLLAGGKWDFISSYFFATIIIAIYSEIMARIFKTPVTTFLLIGLPPLVPGGGIYKTMEYCISGDTYAFLKTGIHTLGIAGALAIGILLVSSVVRLWSSVKNQTKHKPSTN